MTRQQDDGGGFVEAVRYGQKLRMGLAGPPGGGKTYTMLRIAQGLAGDEGRVAVLDSEKGKAALYADEFRFSHKVLHDFNPQRYIDAIHEAERAKFDVLGIDSLSHAWFGKGGALELVDRAKGRFGGNAWAAWSDVTPLQNALIEAITQADIHIIATMRVKIVYLKTKDDRGREQYEKVGLDPVQREGIEHEFDIFGTLNMDNSLTITKSRCSALANAVIGKPGAGLSRTLLDWLEGEEAPPAPVPPEQGPEHDQLRGAMSAMWTNRRAEWEPFMARLRDQYGDGIFNAAGRLDSKLTTREQAAAIADAIATAPNGGAPARDSRNGSATSAIPTATKGDPA